MVDAAPGAEVTCPRHPRWTLLGCDACSDYAMDDECRRLTRDIVFITVVEIVALLCVFAALVYYR